ncbi:BA75_04828T0 [Komagataella pastoris]|uniref:BA75_04828T0 n=1 Tax=Komagataella pastoris TaxID=4922 RepID=A0A1B2JIP9_PICPA|nr:BA75_04828T0 [Komagataella pastoris]
MSVRSGYFKPGGKVTKTRKIVEDEIGVPKFIYNTPNMDWKVIVTSTGRKFFHNDKTNQSVWQIDDDDVNQQLDSMNKDEILVLIGKARGLIVKEKKVCQKKSLVERKIDQEKNVDAEKKELKEVSSLDSSSANVLGLQYSDSESNEDSGSGLHEDKSINTDQDKSEYDSNSESVSLEEGLGIDISNLSDFSLSGNEAPAAKEESVSIFKTLLDDAQLDPFSSWEIESEKIIQDPRYLELDTDNDRSSAFYQWSRERAAGKTVQTDEVKISDDVYQSFAQFIKEQLIVRGVNKSVMKKLYFAEFKRKYRKDPSYQRFLQHLPEKELESFYRQFVPFEEKTLNSPPDSKRKLLLEIAFNSAPLLAKVKQFLKTNPNSDIFDQLKGQPPHHTYIQLLKNFQLSDQFIAKNIVPLHGLSNQDQLALKVSILLEALQLQAQKLKR